MASNNFYLNSDPLLFTNSSSYGNDDMSKQLNDMMMQYQMMQQQKNIQNQQQSQQQFFKDYVGNLDDVLKNTSMTCKEALMSNREYQKLNTELQGIIQFEIMATIKNKINCNKTAINNIERQLEIIKEVNSNIEDEQKRNLSELNDYVKNYSNITFDEYKKKKQEELLNNESK